MELRYSWLKTSQSELRYSPAAYITAPGCQKKKLDYKYINSKATNRKIFIVRRRQKGIAKSWSTNKYFHYELGIRSKYLDDVVKPLLTISRLGENIENIFGQSFLTQINYLSFLLSYSIQNKLFLLHWLRNKIELSIHQILVAPFLYIYDLFSQNLATMQTMIIKINQ